MSVFLSVLILSVCLYVCLSVCCLTQYRTCGTLSLWIEERRMVPPVEIRLLRRYVCLSVCLSVCFNIVCMSLWLSVWCRTQSRICVTLSCSIGERQMVPPMAIRLLRRYVCFYFCSSVLILSVCLSVYLSVCCLTQFRICGTLSLWIEERQMLPPVEIRLLRRYVCLSICFNIVCMSVCLSTCCLTQSRICGTLS
jgi:hypothetical protein